jgi:hypothetical protein
MKNNYLRWVPREFTQNLRHRRREICERLVPVLEATELDSLRMLVTGEESWFLLEHQHSTKWTVARDENPTIVSHTTGTKKSC